MPASSSVLALDLGTKRIGLALATIEARLPGPLTTLDVSESLYQQLAKIIEANNVSQLVVGYPRGLNGQVTAQTKVVDSLINQLKQQFKLPITTQDEALTSHKAEQELTARVKPYKPGDIDALAATYILEDWLSDQAILGHN